MLQCVARGGGACIASELDTGVWELGHCATPGDDVAPVFATCVAGEFVLGLGNAVGVRRVRQRDVSESLAMPWDRVVDEGSLASGRIFLLLSIEVNWIFLTRIRGAAWG